ncbi:MAG: ethylbenzene dehydrogenase-related protein [Bacillota bacterium]
MKFTRILLAIMVIALMTAGCAARQAKEEDKDKAKAAPAATLAAVKTAQAPVIDGKAEAAWDAAKEIQVQVANAGVLQNNTGGKYVNGKTTIAAKAMYDDQNFYMQLKWADPTNSIARTPWIKEGANLVKKDPNEFYEDKLAVLWNINNSVADFNSKGCSVVCHVTDVTDEKTGKKFIKHWTNADNEILDMWHWKLTRQNSLFGPDKPGLMHDQYMDNAPFDPKDKKGAGRHADPGQKEYTPNESEDKKQPKLVHDGPPANGNPYVIVDGLDKTKPFDPAMVANMKEGDFIVGNIAYQITGDPADIKAKGNYADGTWTLEIQRPLKTQSNKDIQFDDLGKEYYFAVAGFDNSQIGHAYQSGVNRLTFAK